MFPKLEVRVHWESISMLDLLSSLGLPFSGPPALSTADTSSP